MKREAYYFDNNLELFDVYAEGGAYQDNTFKEILTEYFVYVPLPFKEGDKVKLDDGSKGTDIAEIAYDPESRLKYFQSSCEDNGDWLSVWVREKYRPEFEWSVRHVSVLSLDYATEEEWGGILDCPEEIKSWIK